MDNKSSGRPENPNYASTKKLIIWFKEKNPAWSPREIRERLFLRLCNSLREKHKDWTEKEVRSKANEYLPSASWIRDYIKEEYKPQAEKIRISKIDNPWSLGTLYKHDLPTEVLPMLAGLNEEAKKGGSLLTIREALWAARLWPFIQNVFTLKMTNSELLLWWARHYAYHERLSNLLKKDFDTSYEDRLISKYPEEFTVVNITYDSFIWDSLIEANGEEWVRAFCRYTLLFQDEHQRLTDEQLVQELLDIGKYLGKDRNKIWKETWSNISKYLFYEALMDKDKKGEPNFQLAMSAVFLSDWVELAAKKHDELLERIKKKKEKEGVKENEGLHNQEVQE